jgi:polyisoprenoid-binding protein YceI
MATTWKFDTTHTEIQFKARHLMITNVTGNFDSYDGTVETTGDDFATAKVSFTVDAASINTNNEQRDAHLKSDDFFSVEKFPSLTFTSTKLEKSGSDDHYILHGDFTIRDVTKPVTLDVDFGGVVTDPWGNVKAGLEVSGKINRKDFGLNWNAVMEAGGVVVSEEIKILCQVELLKAA